MSGIGPIYIPLPLPPKTPNPPEEISAIHKVKDRHMPGPDKTPGEILIEAYKIYLEALKLELEVLKNSPSPTPPSSKPTTK